MSVMQTLHTYMTLPINPLREKKSSNAHGYNTVIVSHTSFLEEEVSSRESREGRRSLFTQFLPDFFLMLSIFLCCFNLVSFAVGLNYSVILLNPCVSLKMKITAALMVVLWISYTESDRAFVC